MVKVVVELEGGLVTSVTTDGPGVEVYVVDRDIEDWSLGGSNKWPDAEHLKAVGGLQLADVSPGRVSTLLGVIAAECEDCDGTGRPPWALPGVRGSWLVAALCGAGFG